MGAPRRCPRTGGLGQGQHLFWRRILRSKIRNPVAAESEGGQKFSAKGGSAGNCLKIRLPKRGAKPRARRETQTLQIGCGTGIRTPIF